MTPEVRKAFDARIRDRTDAQIEAEIQEWPQDSEQRSILRDELAKRRAAAEAPEQERFAKTYAQKERHQRQLIWCSLIAAAIGALIGAAATSWWSSHSQARSDQQPPQAVATPSPTEAPTERQ